MPFYNVSFEMNPLLPAAKGSLMSMIALNADNPTEAIARACQMQADIGDRLLLRNGKAIIVCKEPRRRR